MALVPLKFRPGINRETTSFTNEGGWFDCNKVRFRFGYPEKIGGWIQYVTNAPYLGICRSLFDWVALNGTRYMSVGTNLKYYVEDDATLYDITPIRETTSATDIALNAYADTLNGAIDDTVTTLTLTSASGWPTEGVIKIDSEQIAYTGVSSNDLTGLTRGYNNTTAASHADTTSVLCATIKATDTNHGLAEGDFFTLSGSTGLGGNITAAVIDQEYRVTEVEDVNTYYFDAREVATSAAITVSGTGWSPTPVFANTTDEAGSPGGGNVVGAYQITAGLNASISGFGWGAGAWGRLGWGEAVTTTTTASTGLRLWSQDNFGEDLVICDRNGGIYYWDTSVGTGSRAVNITDLSGSNNAPTIAKQVMVSDNDRHVIAFGCDPELDPGVQDPLVIRFSDSESVTEWESLPTNSAGELRLGRGSEIVVAVETRQQILVFTDISLHTLQYLGAPYTFGVDLVASNTNIAGALAAVAVNDSVFWMGKDTFYMYDGTVRVIPCSVRDYVFTDIAMGDMDKIVAGTNIAFSEVWWHYPASGSTENDRYVVYNYEQNIWYYGTLDRSFWLDRGSLNYPIAAGHSDNYLYLHENGFDDGSSDPAVAISAYVESSQLDLGQGDQFTFISRVIPDITFRNSTASSPAATFTLKARRFPGTTYEDTEDDTTTQSAASPVELYTEQLYTRVRGRSFAIKLASSDTGVTWRMGTPRADVRTDGRR